MLPATRGQLKPVTLQSPSDSETALWGEAQHEILQESTQLGLCSSLGPFGCFLGLQGCAELVGVPFPNPCHTGQDCFLAFFFRFDEHNVHPIHL